MFSGTQDPVTTFVELAGRGGSEARRSERLALAFGLDAKGLLELSGDIRLCERDFSNAISLYRMAGCKHLKVVLKFAASGNVHELLSYLNVLFKGQSINDVRKISGFLCPLVSMNFRNCNLCPHLLFLLGGRTSLYKWFPRRPTWR